MAVAAVVLVCCRSAYPAAGSGERAPNVLVPGSRLLVPLPLTDTAIDYAVSAKPTTGDTAERPISENRREQGQVPDRRDQVRLISTWTPPYHTSDSLVVERRGLAPVMEHLESGGTRIYHYARTRVWGTVQPTDSARRSLDRTFPQPVFAFNEVEVLVRSLPFREGLTVVVPLFSEIDESVERDTITVLGPDATRGSGAWTVRFADPAIVTRYVIDSASRALRSAEITQRRTGTRFRYLPAR